MSQYLTSTKNQAGVQEPGLSRGIIEYAGGEKHTIQMHKGVYKVRFLDFKEPDLLSLNLNWKTLQTEGLAD